MNKATRASKNVIANMRGSAYMIAMITLVVGLILGLALLRLAGGSTIQIRNSVDVGKAACLADAGINYGYWQYMYSHVTLPHTATQQLGSGSFTVTVSECPDVANTVKIQATGHYRDMTYRRTRVIAKKVSIYEMALCVGSSFSAPRSLITGSSGECGDVYINGNLAIQRQAIINGDLHTTGTVLNPDAVTVTGTLTTGAPAIEFPPIDLGYYGSRANRTYYGSTRFTSLDFTVPYEVVYVDGSLQLRGTVSGIGLLVVDGDLQVIGDVNYSSISLDKLAVLVAGRLIVPGSSGLTRKVYGFFYVHNTDGTGCFESAPKAEFKLGGVAADTVGSVQYLKLIADPAYRETDLAHLLRLPGYEH